MNKNYKGDTVKLEKVNDIIEQLNKLKIKDLSIALMDLEHNNGNSIDEKLFFKYTDKYNEYMNCDDLTGLLNEVLQKK